MGLPPDAVVVQWHLLELQPTVHRRARDEIPDGNPATVRPQQEDMDKHCLNIQYILKAKNSGSPDGRR